MRIRISMRWREITRDPWAFGGWVVLGVGLLLLAVSIPLTIWLIQRSGEDGTIPLSGSSGDAAIFGDSAKLEIRRGSAAGSVDGPPAAEGTGEVDLISVGDEDDSGQDLSLAGDVATISDAATLDTQEVPEADPDETKSPAGATGGTADLADTAEFVVRDSDGNIKEQGVIN